jgi:hypothetical protein
MKTTEPKIEIKPLIRDCQYNKNRTADEGQIIDFQVLIDGAIRAVWKQYDRGSRKYELCDPNHDPLFRDPKLTGRMMSSDVRANGKKYLVPMIREMLAIGRIPTVEQLFERAKKKSDEAKRIAAESVAEQAAEAQRQRYETYGPNMLAMIEKLRLAINPLLTELRDGNESLRIKVIKIQKEANELIGKVIEGK